ncbi:MAG: hypothetical protein QXJ75_05095 [Candidatus Bathyarchaeia archaeon]
MPREIKDLEKFLKLSEKTDLCKIKRVGGIVKLKLRTARCLYTYKVPQDKVEEILKRIKCKTEEI